MAHSMWAYIPRAWASYWADPCEIGDVASVQACILLFYATRKERDNVPLYEIVGTVRTLGSSVL
jgi:hypothetical protein